MFYFDRLCRSVRDRVSFRPALDLLYPTTIISTALTTLATVHKYRPCVTKLQLNFSNVFSFLSESSSHSIVNCLLFSPSHITIMVRRKSLLIGINYTGSENELNGCHQDVENIAEFLQYRGYSNDPRSQVIMRDDMGGAYYPSGHNILVRHTLPLPYPAYKLNIY